MLGGRRATRSIVNLIMPIWYCNSFWDTIRLWARFSQCKVRNLNNYSVKRQSPSSHGNWYAARKSVLLHRTFKLTYLCDKMFVMRFKRLTGINTKCPIFLVVQGKARISTPKILERELWLGTKYTYCLFYSHGRLGKLPATLENYDLRFSSLLLHSG